MQIAASSRTLSEQAADARFRAEIAESEVREARARLVTDTLSSRLDGSRGEPRMTAGSGGNAGYGNASRSRVRDQRRPRGGSAQSFLNRTTHDALRRDSQDLDRNNPLAQALVTRSADM